MYMNGFVYVPTVSNGGILSVFGRLGGRGGPSFASGDSFTATLVARDGGQATVAALDNFTFNVPGDSVKGGVGDLLHFKVISQDGSGLALRQVFPKVEAALEAEIMRGDAGIDDIKLVSTSLEQKNEEAAYRAEANKEQQIKAAQALAQVRRGQRNISANSTKQAVSAIVASGLDLNKISFAALQNLVNEIKMMPELSVH